MKDLRFRWVVRWRMLKLALGYTTVRLFPSVRQERP